MNDERSLDAGTVPLFWMQTDKLEWIYFWYKYFFSFQHQLGKRKI